MGEHVALQEGVEIQQQEFVDPCNSGYDRHHGQPNLKAFPAGLVQAFEKLLCEFLQGGKKGSCCLDKGKKG